MQVNAQTQSKKWELLASIPDSLGFAGSYAGTLAGGIIYAGGAQFRGGIPPWDGGQKVWSDKIYFLSGEHGNWREIGRLPDALGYGASASYGEDFFIAAGSDAAQHHKKTFQLTLKGDSVLIKELPELPIALANVAFAQHENYWYVLGGQVSPQAQQASSGVFRLDLSSPHTGWEQLPDYPGQGRILAAAAANKKGVYIFSGASLENGQRTYLIDGYYFDGDSWMKKADVPHPITAAANPGIADGRNTFLFFSGDDGALAGSDLRDKHPGFSREVLTYFTLEDKWAVTGTIPEFLPAGADSVKAELRAPVTTSVLLWNGNIIIPGGESRPAVRTNQVLRYKP